jgi:hypothetical protein
LVRVREVCRFRHYSIRTEEAYANWIKRYILFHVNGQRGQLSTSHTFALQRIRAARRSLPRAITLVPP